MFSPYWLLGSGSGQESGTLVPKQGLGELVHIPLETCFWAGRVSLGVFVEREAPFHFQDTGLCLQPGKEVKMLVLLMFSD